MIRDLAVADAQARRLKRRDTHRARVGPPIDESHASETSVTWVDYARPLVRAAGAVFQESHWARYTQQADPASCMASPSLFAPPPRH